MGLPLTGKTSTLESSYFFEARQCTIQQKDSNAAQITRLQMRNRSVVETRLFRKVDLVADQGIISSQVLDFRTTLDLKVKTD